jgi:hypothetical protein
MVTDEDIHRLSLAQLNDGGYMSAVTESNTGPLNVDRFLLRKMTKEEAYDHLTNIYTEALCLPSF